MSRDELENARSQEPGRSLNDSAVLVSGSTLGGTRVRKRPWIGIAANAAAGRGRGRARVTQLVRALRHEGFRPRIAWTPEDRAMLVAEAAEDGQRCHCLVAAGGDGTVAALINEQPTSPIAVLPCGTENLFARHYHFSGHPTRLARAIVAGCPTWLDLGETPQRRFSLMAGFGFDGDVVTRHHLCRVGHRGIIRPTNRVAYVEPVLRSSFGYRFPPITVSILDPGREETIVGTTVFLFNLPRYALGLPFAPTARGDDGWLDLVVFDHPGPFTALHYLWLVFRGLHLKRSDVKHRLVQRAVISTDGTVPVQLDGDPGGFVTAETDGAWPISIAPAAIEVLQPAKP